jgi:predicted PurR-regulated permease PerM
MRAGVLLRAMAVGALLAFCWAAKPVLITLLVAVMLAFLLEPIARVLQRIRVPNTLASFLAVVLMIAVIYGAGALAIGQAREFLGNLPEYSRHVREAVRSLSRQTEQIRDSVLPSNKNASGGQPSADGLHMVLGGLGTVTELLVMASFVPFLVYFMLSWRQHVYDALVLLFPPEQRAKARSSIEAMTDVIRQFIVGNLLIALILGAVSTLVFALVGVPEFLVVGPLSGLLSVVPYLGVLLAALPPILSAAGSLSGGRILAILIPVLALHLIALNVLYPKLVGGRLSVNPLAITVALLFWGWLWGGFGLLLAIPLTGAMKAVFDHVENLRGWGRLLGDEAAATS